MREHYHKWTDEEKEFLNENQSKYNAREMTRVIKEVFGSEVSESSVRKKYLRNRRNAKQDFSYAGLQEKLDSGNYFLDRGENPKVSGATLCWTCKHSVPNPKNRIGCEWSLFLKPVPGWDAVERRVRMANSVNNVLWAASFHVSGCPKYERDPIVDKNLTDEDKDEERKIRKELRRLKAIAESQNKND